ncbi:adenine-specific methyltransferase EcoRI family protein [Corynebacterium imitans]|uniref:adenine-specific methyltransferase EcoRI family protein n=1 Tax=Corynebacterium imitans TaxID=156978 RepID=UPI001EF1C0B4|nr:adenine-specific methyltransferase EcoRI family protein [Corynebacterium imitans]MCG7279288.1 adenine-specific methyltransferase EcoRI family protein [Corynebacterium imitans]
MGRNIGRSFLVQAKKNRNDEFYTQRSDIDRELAHYENHFEGKVVYCNADHPLKSNFVRYFYDNFERLGLKRLIATGYVLEGETHGTFLDFSGTGKERARFESGVIDRLRGNGDFRSSECLQLLKCADIVVTNPPFSLLREHVAHLEMYSKNYLIIANINAITYKEIFELIHQGRLWLGVGLGRAISGFIVPDHYELYGTEVSINERGERIVSTNNALWLTNLDIPKRHEDIPLTKTYKNNEASYPHYDNLDGINVDKTKDIPSDWFGLMGVPLTFLHKHNPDQFEIVRFRKGDDGRDLRINGKNPYFRIVIRRKRAEQSDCSLTAIEHEQQRLF